MDLGLEQTVETALTHQISQLAGERAARRRGRAVVLDPQTGAVLAMASVPTYNPSWWVGGISDQHYQLLTSQADHDPLLNRAIQGLWAPGSTFKLATATAALERRACSPASGATSTITAPTRSARRVSASAPTTTTRTSPDRVRSA